MTRYTVSAERGVGPVWVFQCQEHPGAISQSKRLDQAVPLMTEAIAWVAQVPEADVEVDLRPKIEPSIIDLLREAHEARQHSEQLAGQATATTRKVAQHLQGDGYTVRDIGAVLGVSYQRAHQLVS